MSQFVFSFQSSPDVESYKSFNAFGTGDNEGPKDGITDKEGEEDDMVDNEGLKDGIVDDEGLLAESGLAKLFIMNVITTVIKITMETAA